MPPNGLCHFPTGLFAIERLDTWVFQVGLAVPLVCIAVLLLWNLTAYLARIFPKKARAVRISPEPPAREGARREPTPTELSPERLQQACSALEDQLVRSYLDLAEHWLRAEQPQKAAAVLKKVLPIRPDGPQAQTARERLRQLEDAGSASHS